MTAVHHLRLTLHEPHDGKARVIRQEKLEAILEDGTAHEIQALGFELLGAEYGGIRLLRVDVAHFEIVTADPVRPEATVKEM